MVALEEEWHIGHGTTQLDKIIWVSLRTRANYQNYRLIHGRKETYSRVGAADTLKAPSSSRSSVGAVDFLEEFNRARYQTSRFTTATYASKRLSHGT